MTVSAKLSRACARISHVPTVTPSLRHSLGDDLGRLAVAVERLTVDRRDPEQFHMAKGDIAAELRFLARAVEGK